MWRTVFFLNPEIVVGIEICSSIPEFGTLEGEVINRRKFHFDFGFDLVISANTNFTFRIWSIYSEIKIYFCYAII